MNIKTTKVGELKTQENGKLRLPKVLADKILSINRDHSRYFHLKRKRHAGQRRHLIDEEIEKSHNCVIILTLDDREREGDAYGKEENQ